MRGASRYHYCGIRPANETIRQIVEYYNSFDSVSGKPITCLSLTEGSDGVADQSEDIDGNSGSEVNEDLQAHGSINEGLVSSMGCLTGLGHGQKNTFMNPSHSLESVMLLPPSRSSLRSTPIPPGLPLPDSAAAQARPPGTLASADAVSAAFSHKVIRRQTSAPSSLHDNKPCSALPHHGQEFQDSLFPDLKTPTAFNFMAGAQTLQSADMDATASMVPASGHGMNPTGTLVAGRSNILHHNWQSGNKEDASTLLTSDTNTARNASSLSRSSTPWTASYAETYSRNGNGDAESEEESTRISEARPEKAAQNLSHRLKARRATLPHLQIKVPFLQRSAASASAVTSLSSMHGDESKIREGETEVGVEEDGLFGMDPETEYSLGIATTISSSSSDAVKQVGEDEDIDHEEEEMDEDNDAINSEVLQDGEVEFFDLHNGKQTARLALSGDETEGAASGNNSELSFISMMHLPLPTLDEVVQSFMDRLVKTAGTHVPIYGNSPRSAASHPIAQSSSEPASRPASISPSGLPESTTVQLPNDVILARNRCLAVLRTLDMAKAKILWEAYKNVHCRRMLQLAQQGRLKEVRIVCPIPTLAAHTNQ